jgi:hypothetical protein
MTPRERAEQIFNDFKIGVTDVYREAVVGAIEQAITAAIEEDRKSRECCERVWKTCAKVADEHARVGREMANREQTFTAEAIANVIRFRSDSENNQQRGD